MVKMIVEMGLSTPYTSEETELGSIQPDYENEAIYQRNRLPPRSYHIPETSILLNGIWDFNYASTPHDCPKSSSNSQNFSWASIEVPGHWQLQGYGHPHYTNFNYPFPVDPPRTPTENPTGTYRRNFLIPDDWFSERQIRLRFDGVDSAYHVWLNSKFVGYSQGSRNPAEFDITSFLNAKGVANEIFVRVYQWSDGSYIEDQDQWWLSGIFRDVTLIAFPSKSRIDDFFIKTLLDSSYEDAGLEVNLDLTVKEDCEISITLLDPDLNLSIATKKTTIKCGTDSYTFQILVRNPRKWTAETPFLYTATIVVHFQNQPIQKIQSKVGFRIVELHQGLISVNGNPIFIRGVNRHDHHPLQGRSVPLEFIRKDLILMKNHNINSIRCSHYPSHPQLPTLADELGFWLIDEADLECHGFAYYPDPSKPTSDNPSWKKAYLDRMEQLIQRDKNHPSIIIWSLGNEAFYGRNHAAMYEYAKSVDPQRLIHYCEDREARTADMISRMYPSLEELADLATKDGESFKKPVVMCEYAHSMGNSGGLQDYQATVRKYRRLQGGFIWEWSNHGLWVDQPNGNGFYAYGGDFGDIPNDGNFVLDGLCYSDHTPGPCLIEAKKQFAPIRMKFNDSNQDLIIMNEYDFIDLGHLRAILTIHRMDESPLLLHTEELNIPAVQPKESVRLSLMELYEKYNASNICMTVSFVTALPSQWAEVGFEIAWAQRIGTTKLSLPLEPSVQNPLRLFTTSNTYKITGNEFSFEFDSTRASLINWKWRGMSVFATNTDTSFESAIHPGFWRPPTDNDLRGLDGEYRRHGLHALTCQCRSFTANKLNDGSVQINAVLYVSPPVIPWGFQTKVRYLIAPNGSLIIHVKSSPSGFGIPQTLPRVGLDIHFNKELNIATWFGRGPGESYPDKCASQKIGIYTASLNELYTPYEVPQENGNRMDTYWVKMSTIGGLGIKMTRNDGSEFHWKGSSYSSDTIDSAKHPTDLVEDSIIHFRLDSEVSGVGSAACGPLAGDEYVVQCDEKEFEFKLEPTI